MAIFPKIQSPCPYKNDLASVMDGDMCRMCKRQVFDISDWTDAERVAFLKGCSGEVCVSYKMSTRLAAAALIVAAVTTPSAATACTDATDDLVVFVGGIKDPHNAEYVKDTSDGAVPELPIVYEQSPAADARASQSAVSQSAVDTERPTN